MLLPCSSENLQRQFLFNIVSHAWWLLGILGLLLLLGFIPFFCYCDFVIHLPWFTVIRNCRSYYLLWKVMFACSFNQPFNANESVSKSDLQWARQRSSKQTYTHLCMQVSTTNKTGDSKTNTPFTSCQVEWDLQ